MTGRPDESSSSFSDEDWATFQQEAADSVRRRGGEAPKEPSARAREVTARLRSMDERAAAQRTSRGWRLGRRRPKPAAAPAQWQPEGWRTGPAWREMQGRGRRRKLGAAVGAVAFVAVAFLGGGAFVKHRGWTDAAADETPLRAETAAPTAAPPTRNPDLPTKEHPFAGSPAHRWAAGAAAIQPPEAKAVNGVPADLVADGLRRTKNFLVAANLDRDVLNGGRPTKALGLVDPLEKEYLKTLRRSLGHPTARNAPTMIFSRFDTDEVRLVGAVVKVRGRMTVRPGKEAGHAEIHADYTFVYPVTRASGSEEVTRTIARRVVEAEVVARGTARVTPGTLWITRSDGSVGNSACSATDGLLHPSFPTDRAGGPGTDGPTTDPYDRSKPLTTDPAAQCGTVTRV